MREHTPTAVLRQHTVAQLREIIKGENGGVAAPSKLRKAELIQYLEDIWHNQDNALHNQPMAGSPAAVAQAEEELVDVASEAAYAEMARQVDALVERELAAVRQREMIKEQGRVATQAWRNTPVAFTSMGTRVQGQVVAVTLRPRVGRDHTSYDFLMTVAHAGHPTRRTLHALHEIDLMVLAS